jgi:hypothetical protein
MDSFTISAAVLSAAMFLGFGPLSSINDRLREIRRAIEEQKR